MSSFLTDTEQTWLYQNIDELTWAPQKDYFPLVYYEDGSVQGISYDFVRLVESKLGVTFPTGLPDSLKNILDEARQGELGFVTSLTFTEERDAYLDFTNPYLKIPVVLLVNHEGVQPRTLMDVQTNLYTLGVGESRGVISYLNDSYPDLNLVEYANDETVLQALSEGTVDAAVVDVASAAYQMSFNDMKNIDVQDQIDFNYELSFAVPESKKELVPILNKAMAQISVDERQALLSEWSLKSQGSIGSFEAPTQGIGAVLDTSRFSVPTWAYVLFAGAVLLLGVAMLMRRLLSKKRR